MSTSKSLDPVPIVYRFGGAFFGLVAVGLLVVAWLSKDSGWYVELGLVLGGLGLLVPSIGMIFARTHEGAKRAASWLMLDIFLPI